jgi:hypothetical protein
MQNKVRIEIHLDDKEVKVLDKIAKEAGRSRKNLCENEIRILISNYLLSKKSKNE